MTKTDSTSADGLASTSLPLHRLARLEDQLNQLLACYEFYDLAIRAITGPEYTDEINGRRWQFGLFLHQQWLQDQGQAVITELQTIQRESQE